MCIFSMLFLIFRQIHLINNSQNITFKTSIAYLISEPEKISFLQILCQWEKMLDVIGK